jgi:hypothetical protein
MAYDNILECVTIPANADLSTGQFYCVALSTDSQAAYQTTAGGVVAGIVQDKSTAAGHGAVVAVKGITKAVVDTSTSAGLAAGAALSASTSATLVSYTTLGAYVVGRLQEAVSSGVLSIAPVMLTFEGISS